MTEVAALVIATGVIGGRAIAVRSWGTDSVLGHVLGTVREAGIERIVVVVGPGAESILEEVEMGEVTIVIDPEWSEGPAASLRCGLDELMRSDDTEEAVLVTVEQPQVSADVIAGVVAVRRESERPAAIPKYRYATGLPLIVHRDLWPRLMGLEGEASAEVLLKAHPEWAQELWVDSLAPRTVTSEDELTAIAPRV